MCITILYIFDYIISIPIIKLNTYTHNNKIHATARIISMYDNVNCSGCERNEGLCFELSNIVNGNNSNVIGNRDPAIGCACPVSRSGPECSKVHGK